MQTNLVGVLIRNLLFFVEERSPCLIMLLGSTHGGGLA